MRLAHEACSDAGCRGLRANSYHRWASASHVPAFERELLAFRVPGAPGAGFAAPSPMPLVNHSTFTTPH